MSVAVFKPFANVKAMADGTVPAEVTSKVTASVEDSGSISFSNGMIKNNGDVLSIGVRYVNTESSVDLSEAKLTIKCADTVLYDKQLGTEQTNTKYCSVPKGSSQPLYYSISMDAQKAKQLVGSSPVTISTVVDLICSPKGKVVDDDGNAIKNATITYSYYDEYLQKTVEAKTSTDSNGEYVIPEILKGTDIHVVASKDGMTSEVDVKAEEDQHIQEQVLSSYALPPTVAEGLVYTGEEQVGVFGGSNIELTGQTAGVNAGKYTAYATPKDKFKWKDGSLDTKSFEWEIAKADMPAPDPSLFVATAESFDKKPDGKISGLKQGMEYSYDGVNWIAVEAGQTELTGLNSGDYFIRYMADNNHNASDSTTVTVKAGPKTKVTYFGNGNDSGQAPVDSTEYSYNDELSALDKGSLSKVGYNFDSWNTKADGTGTSIAVGSTYKIENPNPELYAVWVNKLIPTANMFNFEGPTREYDAKNIPASVTVKDGIEGMGEITIFYRKAEAGTWTKDVPKDAGNYYVKIDVAEGSQYAAQTDITSDNWTFTISPLDISSGAQVGQFEAMTYNGNAQTPKATVTKNDLSATGTWGEVINVSDKAVFTANGNFTGLISTDSGMNKADMESVSVDKVPNQDYTGKEIKPEPTAKLGNYTLVKGKDFDYEYANNIEAGTATITLKAKEVNFTDSKNVDFTINKAKAEVTDPPKAIGGLTYNADSQILASAGTCTGGTMYYLISDTKPATTDPGWDTNLPKGTDAKTYHMYYYAKGDKNHNDTAVLGPVDCMINQKTVEVQADNQTTSVGHELAELTYTAEKLIGEDKYSGNLVTNANKDIVGTYEISQGTLTAGNNYKINFIKGTYIVTAKKIQNLEFDDKQIDKTYGDGTFTQEVKGAVTPVTYSINKGDVASVDSTTGQVTILNAGSAIITATAEETEEYALASASYILVVAKVKVDLPTAVEGLIYNGTEQTGIELPEGAKYTLLNNKGTNAKKYSATATLTDKTNYEWNISSPTSDDQTIGWSIAKLDITLYSLSGSKTYDGQPLTAPEVYKDSTKAPVDTVFTNDVTYLKATGTVTNVLEGDVTNTISYSFKDGKTEDNFNINKTEGKLTINRADATVSADNKSKTYGEADPKLTATVTGTIGTDALLYTVTRTTGEDKGTYEIIPTGDQEQGNYNVTYTKGTFTINAKDLNVAITGNTDTKEYNTSEQSVEGFTTNVTPPETAKIALKSGKKAEAKGTNVGDYMMNLKTDMFEETSGNYNVTFSIVQDGKLTITKKALNVAITGNSVSKTYNTSEQSIEGFTTNVAPPETAIIALKSGKKAEAKGTNVGDYMMNLKTEMFEETSGNYDVTFSIAQDGKLTITKAESQIQLTDTSWAGALSDSKVFSVDSFTGSGDTGVSYSAESKDTGIALVSKNTTPAEGKLATFTITPKAAGSTTITVTAKSDNYKDITATVSVEVKCTLTYDANNPTSGNVPASPALYSKGAEVTILANTGSLAKTAAAFAGWNTQSDGKGKHYDASGSVKFNINADTTLYAEWGPVFKAVLSNSTVANTDFELTNEFANTSKNDSASSGLPQDTPSDGSATVATVGDSEPLNNGVVLEDYPANNPPTVHDSLSSHYKDDGCSDPSFTDDRYGTPSPDYERQTNAAYVLTFYYDNKDHSSDTIAVKQYLDLPTNATTVNDWPYFEDTFVNNVINVVVDKTMESFYGLTSTSYMFSGASNGFWNANALSGLEYLKVDNVTNMLAMFSSFGYYSTGFNSVPDTTNWNTAQVTNMNSMFRQYGYSSTTLTKVPVTTNWNTNNVTDMSNMFVSYGIASTKLADVPNTSNWNTNNVIYMTSMFNSYAYKSGTIDAVPDTSKWNTGDDAKIQSLAYTFRCYGCYSTALSKVPDTTNWNTKNVNDMSYMFNFYGYTSSNFNGVPNTETWNTSKVTTMAEMFNAYGYSSTKLDKVPTTSNWNTNKVTDMTKMFNSYACRSQSIDAVPDTSKWNTGDDAQIKSLKSTFSNFGYSSKALSKVPETSNWNTKNVIDMSFMFAFYGITAPKFNCVPNTEKWNTSNVTTMLEMFNRYGYSSTELVQVPVTTNWNTDKVTDMTYLFNCYAYSSQSIDDVPDTSNWNNGNDAKIQLLQCTFRCYGYSSKNLSKAPNTTNWNTKNVTEMSYLFCSYGYTSTTIAVVPDTSKWDTANVKSMPEIFGWYGFKSQSLQVTPDLSSWNTSNVTDMTRMFRAYASDRNYDMILDLSSFDTSKVTSMEEMFFDTNFKTIYVSDSWNTSLVTSSSNMFSGYEEPTANYILVFQGGNGTKYDRNNTSIPRDKTRAIVDKVDSVGYLTYKSVKSATTHDECQITYDLNDGIAGTIAPYTQQVKQGTKFTVQGSTADDCFNQISDPTRNGLAFGGWTVGEDTTIYKKGDALQATGTSMTLKAVWIAKYDVSFDQPKSGQGTIASTGTLTGMLSGTQYTVSGNTITFATGEDPAPAITYSQQDVYTIANWAYSTDGGTNWTDLEDNATGTITANTKFKAVTAEVKSLTSNGVQYWPVFDASHPLPEGVMFFAKDSSGKYTKLTDWTTMAELKQKYEDVENKSELCYASTGTQSFACVTEIIGECFNDAFGSNKTVASEKSDNKAYEYIGSKFADKLNASCVPLLKDWYTVNTDATTVSTLGKFGPGQNFDFTTQKSSTEPLLDGVGVNSIQAAYYNGSDYAYVVSCVSNAVLTGRNMWTWNSKTEKSLWQGDAKYRNTAEYSIPFVSYFGGAQSVAYNSDTSTTHHKVTGMSAGDKIVVPGQGDLVAPAGKKFNGWNTKADGTGTAYAVGSEYTVTADATVKLYAQWVDAIAAYAGTVKLFSVDNPEGNPLQHATVTFNDGTSTPETVATDEYGKFTFVNSLEKTPGILTVSYYDATNTYSVHKFTTTTETRIADLPTFEIRKLTSLAVSVKSGGSTLNTFWCPAFTDGDLNKSKIKFYDENKCEVDGTATSGKSTDYKMSDLYDSSTKKSKGQYFAFTKEDQKINCYQTTDALWNDAFKYNSTPSSYPATADKLADGFITNGQYCSDKTAKTVYFDGSTEEKEQWAPVNDVPDDSPTLNGVRFSDCDDESGWYYAYGGENSSVLSANSYQSTSSVLSESRKGIFCPSTWIVVDNNWDSYGVSAKESEVGIVLFQTFSNETFEVSAEVDDPDHGTVLPSAGETVYIPYGTEYEVNGDIVTIKDDPAGPATFTYMDDESGYELDYWQISTDGGTTWTKLADGASGTITADITFKAKTKLNLEYKSLKSDNNVYYFPIFNDGELSTDFTFYYKDGEEYKKIDGTYEGGKYKMSDLNSNAYILYYTNTGSNTLPCITFIKEDFNTAFSNEVATTPSDNKAIEYKGVFKDIEIAQCMALDSTWYSTNSDSTKYDTEGKYGPSSNFDFSSQTGTEPMIKNVKWSDFCNSYAIMGLGYAPILSCVSNPINVNNKAWVWTKSENKWFDLDRTVDEYTPCYNIFLREVS